MYVSETYHYYNQLVFDGERRPICLRRKTFLWPWP